MNARFYAISSLVKVNDDMAFSNKEIDNTISQSNMSTEDRNLYTNIVYGTLQNQIYIDNIINMYSNRKIEKLDSFILNLLRISVYQLFFLDKVPIYAIVDEAVKITKKNKYSARGFVNAILREIIREKETIKTNKKLNKLGIRFSVPQWIIDEYINVFGKDLGKQIIQALNNKPPLTVRCNKNLVSRDVFSKILDDNNVEYKYTKISENGLIIKIKQSISNYHWFKDGLCSVQDQGAMIAVEILNPDPDEKVLDMCAAPGGKTTYISELMNNTGIVVAKDIYETRLKQINELSERLNLTNIQTIINDGTVLNKEEQNRYDKILVDAPCSGLGVLRRKPEIKHKISQYDIGVIIQTQEKILRNSIRYLKHGGTLVYVTCTVNRQENEEQIDKILQQYPEMKLIKHQYQEELYHSNDKLYGYTHPLMDQCDCFFIAKLKKDNMEK